MLEFQINYDGKGKFNNRKQSTFKILYCLHVVRTRSSLAYTLLLHKGILK